jgi:type III pantothenate kinase
VGANLYFPNQDVLVIDAGTCIKYDFVNKANAYLGGSISPGLQMRFKALHTLTEKLPLVQPVLNVDYLIGSSTEEAILSGVLNGCIAEIDGIIQQYKSNYKNLKVVLSGGDSIYFDKTLKNSIFASPNIVLEGLNAILDYNVDKQNI